MREYFSEITKYCRTCIAFFTIIIFSSNTFDAFGDQKSDELVSQNYFSVIEEDENGAEHMNVNVVSASIDGAPLVAGDEIGVFSGNHCVGAVRIEKPLSVQLTSIICSGV